MTNFLFYYRFVLQAFKRELLNDKGYYEFKMYVLQLSLKRFTPTYPF